MKNFTFQLGELFCGPGGLALGAGLANETITKNNHMQYHISHTWGVDSDKAAIQTYEANIEKKYGGKSICMDASQFCKTKIKEYPRITALAFGFPCNDFSLVGKRKGLNGSFGNLYKAGIDAINKNNPYWFIAENVSGIHSSNAKKTFPLILDALQKSGKHGYNLTVHKYKFEEYGVAQYRHRYIIVGIRKDQNMSFKVPAPICKAPEEYLSVEKAFKTIPKTSLNHDKTHQSPKIITRLKYTPPWHNAWYLETLLTMSNKDRRKTLQQKLTWYTEEIANLSDYAIKKEIEECRLHCTKAKMSHIYKRLKADRPSYTVTGSGGGGTHIYHWSEHRALTNRERAKIQSFPDWFEFKGTKEQQRKQIGMAVPPEAAKTIFEAILKTFAGIPYEHVPANYSFRSP